MKPGSTLFLRAVIALMGLGVLTFCIFLPIIVQEEGAAAQGGVAYTTYILIGILYLTAVPFFIGLFQGFKMLHYIDKGNAFSALSANALRRIKYCAVTVGVIWASLFLLIFRFAQDDDAPGVILIFLVIMFAPFAIATFAAVLEKLLRSAIELKSENELTV